MKDFVKGVFIGFSVIVGVLWFCMVTYSFFIGDLYDMEQDAQIAQQQAQIDSLKVEAQVERIERLECQLDSLLFQYRLDLRAARQQGGKR